MDDDSKVAITAILAIAAVIIAFAITVNSNEAKLMKVIAVERGYGTVDERGVFKWKDQK